MKARGGRGAREIIDENPSSKLEAPQEGETECVGEEVPWIPAGKRGGRTGQWPLVFKAIPDMAWRLFVVHCPKMIRSSQPRSGDVGPGGSSATGLDCPAGLPLPSPEFRALRVMVIL